MNIILIIIVSIFSFAITQLFVILGRKIERTNFENWLLKNNYFDFLIIYSKYKKVKENDNDSDSR